MKQSLLVTIFTLSLTQPVWASDRDFRRGDGHNTTPVINNKLSGVSLPAGTGVAGNLLLGTNTGTMLNNSVNNTATNTNTFTPTNTATNTNTNTNTNRNINNNTNSISNTNTNTNRSTSRSTAAGGSANVTVNNTGNTNTSPASSDITIRNTPAVAPPAIYGTNNCALGVSAGVSIPGLGLGGGFSYESQNCEIRAQAALAHTTGQQDVAQEVMCELPAYRQARLRVGRPCVQDQTVSTSSAPTPVTQTMNNTPVNVTTQAPRPAFCNVVGLNVHLYPECG